MTGMWLLSVNTVMQIYNGDEQVGQKEIQNGNTKSLVLKEIRSLKKSLMLNGIKGMVPSGKIPHRQASNL